MNVRAEYTLPGGQIVRIGQGDLTAEPVAAIVNAANEHLMHGGGVAGAIVRAGGAAIQQESSAWVREHGRVPTGQAAITGAGSLPARYVIHAVGPVWGSSAGSIEDSETLLASAVQSALALADKHDLASIALPGISSGIFGGPKDVCARVILQAAVDYVAQHPDCSVRELHFCNIDNPTVQAFLDAAEAVLGGA